jgi:hypothetical protein
MAYYNHLLCLVFISIDVGHAAAVVGGGGSDGVLFKALEQKCVIYYIMPFKKSQI